MHIHVPESGEIKLPDEVTKKYQGKDLEIIETVEGILLRPRPEPIQRARGFLKGSKVTNELYIKNKKEEKAKEQ